MSVLNPKTRLVSFRLSQEEYSELCALCAAQRARSISDFVRDNMHWILEQGDRNTHLLSSQPLCPPGRPEFPNLARPVRPGEVSALSDMLVSLHRRTDDLDRRVRQLAQLVRAVAGRSTSTPTQEPADESQPMTK